MIPEHGGAVEARRIILPVIRIFQSKMETDQPVKERRHMLNCFNQQYGYYSKYLIY